MTIAQEKRLRVLIGGLAKDVEAGAITVTEFTGMHTLDIELLRGGEHAGRVQWIWPEGGKTVTWTGLDTPVDSGWLSYLSGALPPFAAKLGFEELSAPGITPELREVLPLTGLVADENGDMRGDLKDKQSRFWEYLDYKVGKRDEPQWRKDLSRASTGA